MPLPTASPQPPEIADNRRADAELANAGIFLHQSLALEQMPTTAPSPAAPHARRSTR